MDEASTTTAAVQQYLVDLAQAPGRSSAEPLVRALLARAVDRLRLLCSALLYRSYPRLTQAPLNLEADELLSAVVERLMKALDKVRPASVRQFFALANQHIRWELNDLARRLDEKGFPLELVDGQAQAPENSASTLGLNARRMLQAIDSLPEEEGEVFSLVRIQGLSQTEVAELLEISPRTVLRRLNRSLLLLTEMLADLRPDPAATGDASSRETP
jgi:RNA polymerase sigma-70 factor (ECF subfamily)